MSNFGEEIIGRLNANSPLNNPDNPMNKLINNTIGEWLDNYDNQEFYEQFFLNTAKGDYLDFQGKLYNIYRKFKENDEDFRKRITYETLGHLTINYLNDIYNLSIYNAIGGMNVNTNLTSDNPHISNYYFSFADKETQGILDKKFGLGNYLIWVNSDIIGILLDINDNDLMKDYSYKLNQKNVRSLFSLKNFLKRVKLDLPNVENCNGLFFNNGNLISVDLRFENAVDCQNLLNSCDVLNEVKLELPKANNCSNLLRDCDSLLEIGLDLPQATKIDYMFYSCANLKNVILKLPSLETYTSFLSYSPKIEIIDLTIPPGLVNAVKSYILGLNLQSLTSLKINGEEYIV